MSNSAIIKQDINFLDKPLWMVELKHDGKGFIWKDIEGFEYRTGYTLPDKTDALILLYLLYQSQKLGFQNKIVISRYEILKGCSLSTNSQYYARLEESLRRWTNIYVEFKGTFYEDGNHITIGFGIIDKFKVDEKNKLLHINFNEDWLLKIKESNFFKYINFERYKALKRPVSRRLYEILCKNFKGRDECFFKLTTLGKKLTLSGLKRKTRTGAIEEIIYASHVLLAVKPAINEINKQAMTPEIAKKADIPAEDLFTISYRIEGEKQERVIHLTKHPVATQEPSAQAPQPKLQVPEEPAQVPITLPTVKKASHQPKLPDQLEEQYEAGIKWLKQMVPNFNLKIIDKMNKEEVAAYFPKLMDKFQHDSANGKIENPGAYVTECLRNKWEKTKTRKDVEREEKEMNRLLKEQKKQETVAIKDRIMPVIEAKGGVRKAKYNGKTITIADADGILVDRSIFFYWWQVDAEKIG